MNSAENSEFSVESTPVIGQAGASDGNAGRNGSEARKAEPAERLDADAWVPEKTPAQSDHRGLGLSQTFGDDTLSLLQGSDSQEHAYPSEALIPLEMGDFEDSALFTGLNTVAALQDSESGDQYHISRLPFTIGRSEQSDLVINEASVALKQAELIDQFGRFVIRNLYDPVEPGTEGGIQVNGYRVDQVILENGDEIQIGQMTLIFRSSPDSISFTKPKARKQSKSHSKRTGASFSFKRQWLLILPMAAFVYAGYLLYTGTRMTEAQFAGMEVVRTEPAPQQAVTQRKTVQLIGDTYEEAVAFGTTTPSPLAQEVQSQVKPQAKPLVSKSLDAARAAAQEAAIDNAMAESPEQKSTVFPANMITDGWPQLPPESTSMKKEAAADADWSNTMEADFAMLSGEEVAAVMPPPVELEARESTEAFPVYTNDDTPSEQQPRDTLPEPPHVRQQPASMPQQAMSQLQSSWLSPITAQGMGADPGQLTPNTQKPQDPFLSLVDQKLAALSEKEQAEKARKQAQTKPVMASENETTMTVAQTRPELAMLETTQGAAASQTQTTNRAPAESLIEKLISGDTVEEEARNLILNAEIIYREEGAKKVLELLRRYHSEPSISSRIRGELNSTYESYNRLYQAYSRGQKAFAMGEKEAAFKQWAIFLRDEKKVLYDAQPSVYANEVKRIVAKEYVDRASHAEQRQAWSLAWHNWENASRFGETVIAKEHLHRIELLAKRYFDDGVAVEQSNPTAASENWMEVMAILPENHPLHDRAKAKMAWLSQWQN